MLTRSPTTERLGGAEFWRDLLAFDPDSGRRPWRRLGAYRRLVASGQVEQMVHDYAMGTLSPEPPVRHSLTKADGRKKIVFTFATGDELMFKALNRALPATLPGCLSPLCHSFQPGRGPRSAYRDLLAIPGLDRLACLHMDVRDYFNSIPPYRLLGALPPVIAKDGPLYSLLSSTLRDPRVLDEGCVREDDHKGVMAGTPLAPLLSNLYLLSLDRTFEASAVPYLRYADDIVVFAPLDEIERHREHIEERLQALGLELNQRKTRVSRPGQPWEFLGLRYDRGSLDVAPNTAAKLRRRARRIARRARDNSNPAAYALRRLNRRLYGIGGRPVDFSWAGWFFPLLTGDSTLRRLDAVIQGHLRFAVTGVHERRNLRAVPYSDLQRAGYLPLASAFHAHRDSQATFDRLLADRCLPAGGKRP